MTNLLFFKQLVYIFVIWIDRSIVFRDYDDCMLEKRYSICKEKLLQRFLCYFICITVLTNKKHRDTICTRYILFSGNNKKDEDIFSSFIGGLSKHAYFFFY